MSVYDKQQTALQSINKEYDDTAALQERNYIITNAISKMASELSLTEQQVKELSESYGAAFETGNTKNFDTMLSSIRENIKAYEDEIRVRKELGEVIDDFDISVGKNDIAKNGILEIVDTLELTEAQVLELKKEFGNLFKEVARESQSTAEYMKKNWANVSNEIIGLTGGFIDAAFDFTNHRRWNLGLAKFTTYALHFNIEKFTTL